MTIKKRVGTYIEIIPGRRVITARQETMTRIIIAIVSGAVAGAFVIILMLMIAKGEYNP